MGSSGLLRVSFLFSLLATLQMNTVLYLTTSRCQQVGSAARQASRAEFSSVTPPAQSSANDPNNGALS